MTEELKHADFDVEAASLEDVLNNIASAVLALGANHTSEKVRFYAHETHRARDSYLKSRKPVKTVEKGDK